MKKASEGWTRDASLDTLLDLDGAVLVIDEKGGYWVKFEVRRVEATSERPHGLYYSLTLHGNANERLVGFDNAHGCGNRRAREERDGQHTTTSIGFGPLDRTSTAMPPHCYPIFGPRWTPC